MGLDVVTLALAKTYADGVAGGANAGITIVTASGGDITTAVNNALSAAGAYGHVRIIGDGVLSDSLVVQHDGQVLDGLGTLSVSGMTNKPMLKVLNCSYFEVGDGLFFDPNWASGVTAIQVVGGLLGKIRLLGDRLPVGLDFDCSLAAATQNSALNEAWVTIRNGVAGMRFKGKAGQYASNNRIHVFNWWGAGSVVSTGVDYVQYCDNNTVGGYINLNSAGSIGMIYNSSSPSTDVGVYENHFDGIVDATVASTTALKGNRTYGSLGQYPAFVRLRIGGGNGAAVDIAADSDIILYRSNLDGTPEGFTGDTVVAVSVAQMATAYSAPTGQLYDQKYIDLEDAQANEYAWSQVAIPSEWKAFDIIVDWALSGSAGGDVDFTVTLNQLASGAAPNAGTGHNVVATGGAQNALLSTTVASGVLASSAVGAFRITRNGNAAGDTATDNMRVYMLRLKRAA